MRDGLACAKPSPVQHKKERLSHLLSDVEVSALVGAHHSDPFAVLGMHADAAGAWWIRVLLPGAATVAVHDARTGQRIAAIGLRHPDGLFEGVLPRRRKRFDYRLHVQWRSGSGGTYADAFSFAPQIGDQDLYFLGEGSHLRPFEVLGAHALTIDEKGRQAVEGVRFAVWAPNARRVSVVADFNNWDGRRHPMRRRGIVFYPGADASAFEIRHRNADIRDLRARQDLRRRPLGPHRARLGRNADQRAMGVAQ